MEYFPSLSVSSSLIIGRYLSLTVFLVACAPLPGVWTPVLPSPGPAPVPASLGADRGPGGLGLGPAPRQWTRLQRQGDNLPESHKNPDNTGFNIPPVTEWVHGGAVSTEARAHCHGKVQAAAGCLPGQP